MDEFTKIEAKILQDGLESIYPKQASAIFKRIYYWTNGYPYLTQKLCLAVAQRSQINWTDAHIDSLVEELFLSEAARKDSNLQFVQDKTLSHPKRRQLLNLYKKVYQGEKVANDGQSIIQNQLKLSGLLKEEGGYLHTRNNIYTRVFDLAWVKENTAIDWVRIFAGAAALVAIVALFFIAYNSWIEQQVDKYTLEFHNTNHPQEQAKSLAKILRTEGFWGSPDYDYQARELFYNNLSGRKQLDVFDDKNVPHSDLINLVQGLYTTLADVDGNNSNQPVLEAMEEALRETEETTTLRSEINSWLQAREMVQQGQLTQALNEYNKAIAFRGDNPATLYERARVLTNLSRDEEALRDLELVVTIAGTLSAPATPTPVPGTTPSEVVFTFTPISNQTPNVTITPSGSVTALPRQIPTPTATPILSPFTSNFDTLGKMIAAVRTFIQANPRLIAVGNSNVSQYDNLEGVGILPAATPTTVFTPVPTSTPLSTFTPVASNSASVQTSTPIPPMPTPVPVQRNVGISLLSPAQNERVKSNEVQFRVQVNGFENGDRLQLRASIDQQNWSNENVSFTFDGSAYVANMNYQPYNAGFGRDYYWQVLVIAPDGTTLAESGTPQFRWEQPSGGNAPGLPTR